MAHEAQRRIDAVVVESSMLTADIKEIRLAPADGSALPDAPAGSHIDLWLPDGKVRQYSVVERAVDGSSYSIAVFREPCSRGGSAWIVDRLCAGQKVQLSGPRNNFALDERGDEYVLIAGGIGITPILPMALQLLSARKRLALCYLARTKERAALLNVIEAGPLRHVVRTHFSNEQGEIDLRELIGKPRANAHVYVCGPAALIDGVLAAGSDWPQEAIHFERFAANGPMPPARGPFEIELARSGKTFTVQPDQSIMKVLQNAGIRIDSVCREGICGTCAVPLLAGEAMHCDAIQTDAEKAENRVIYVCVSRAKSAKLVLDL
jgi:ferredoxin-NADP reductase